MQLSSCAFGTVRRTLLKGVNEDLFCFLHFFCPLAIKFCIGVSTKRCCVIFGFVKLRRGVNGFLSVLSVVRFRCQFGTKVLHVMMSCRCEFPANRRREGRTLCMGVNRTTFTGVPWNLPHSDIKERLGEVCVLRHVVRDLQCLYNRDAVFTARCELNFHK